MPAGQSWAPVVHQWCACVASHPSSWALMGYFYGCLMNHKNLIWLCPIDTFTHAYLLIFILNLIITELLYRLGGHRGCTHSCRKVYNLFLRKENRSLICIWYLRTYSDSKHPYDFCFSLSHRLLEVSYHTAQCERSPLASRLEKL